MESEKRILFVCTGNTCRSPMAEGIFRAATHDNPLLVSTGSAGVAAYDGDQISPDTAAELSRRNASLENFKSRSVTRFMLEDSTHVFAMTSAHLHTLIQAFPEHAEKCYLVCDFYEIDDTFGADIPDPIGMGASAYKHVGEIFQKVIPSLIEFVLHKESNESNNY